MQTTGRRALLIIADDSPGQALVHQPIVRDDRLRRPQR